MPTRILVPVDGSPQSEDALAFALSEFPDAEITVLHVIDPIDGGYSIRSGIPTSSQEWFEQAKADANELFEEAKELASEHGTTVESDYEVGRPANTIVEYAETNDCDHVVVGSHGRTGVSRILLGSVAETVVRRASIPVTVVR